MTLFGEDMPWNQDFKNLRKIDFGGDLNQFLGICTIRDLEIMF